MGLWAEEGSKLTYLLKGFLWSQLCGKEFELGQWWEVESWRTVRKLLWSECVSPKFLLKS